MVYIFIFSFISTISLSSLFPSCVMLRNKSFAKKTRKGGVLLVQREVYLRDDIPCGSTLCELCSHFPGAPPPRLSISRFLFSSVLSLFAPVSCSNPFPLPSFLIPFPSIDEEEGDEGVEFSDDGNTSLPVYLVVDTNVALHQIDVLEHRRLRNLIFPQTVMEEVKHRNPLVHSRIRYSSPPPSGEGS